MLAENRKLKSDLRSFVAVAMQNGLQHYCLKRHPDIVRDLEAGVQRSEQLAESKYGKVLSMIQDVPGLRATRGETGERTYYLNAVDNVAYLEHELLDRRFVLHGIWVAPSYRGQGIAHRILRRLVDAADEADCGLALYHEPFGSEGLNKEELEAFYGRHGFQNHGCTPGGLFRFPKSPLDLYSRRQL
ncbi:hypothetical protein Salmuc_02067 [Salipiger mucosus DSM 16094]|uniref:N-acetyltransferase domain-containing protein n=1 Tax=Salipiger mucosus DSM 16094 TaxID=1123237 RepID=S9SB44_9RHOB|nr:hypothetical protein Salmuc_02067 [Salipiger mucosus DSM 16094]